jgi:hypothetical protein
MLYRLRKNVKKWVSKVWDIIGKGPKNMEWPA